MVSDRSPRWKANAAVVGLGITEMGKVYGRSAAYFAAEAVARALDDAGLQKSDIDGLLVNGNGNVDMEPRLQMALGLRRSDDAECDERRRIDVGRDGAVRGPGPRRGRRQPRRAPLRRHAAAAGRHRGRGVCAPRLVGRHERLAGGLRRVRRQSPVRARRAPAHAPVRHDERAARRDRGRAAPVGPDEPARADEEADDPRGPPELADGRRALPPLRLLPRLERRGRRDHDHGRAREAPAGSRRSTSGPRRRPRRETTSAAAGIRGSTRARSGPARRRSRWPASRATTSTSSSCTTATRTPSSSRSRTTASARRARAARSSRTASSVRAARSRRTRAAASSRPTTCGASRRSRKR